MSTRVGAKLDLGPALLGAMQDGVIVRDAEGAIVEVNPAFCRLTGYGRDELLGRRPPHPFWAEEHRDRLSEWLRRSLAGQTWEHDFALVDKGGQRVEVIVTAAPILDDAGRPAGCLSTYKDVTYRKRHERDLHAAAEFNLSVLNSLAANVCVVGADGNILAVNRAWEEFARGNGARDADRGYVGRNYIGTCAAASGECSEEGPAVADAVRSVLDGRAATFSMEYPCHCPEQQRWFLMTVSPLAGPEGSGAEGTCPRDRGADAARGGGNGRPSAGAGDGEARARPRGAVIAHIDITDRKLAEEARRRHAEEMTRLAERLRRSNEELDQFAYVTSHDLRAPLRGIANLSRWIEEDIGDRFTPEAHAQMNLLRGRVQRMENLIEGLLQYSRIGRKPVRAETVDVALLLREVVDLLAPPPGADVTAQGPLPVLRTRRLPLQQVLQNLIANAIAHGARGRGTVRVRVRVRDRQDGYYEFAVADDGPGIAPEYHEKIFAIFQTLEPRDKVEGTGIGLSVVKKTVEGAGGRVRVESTPGRGATFYFTWPKVIPDEEAHD